MLKLQGKAGITLSLVFPVTQIWYLMWSLQTDCPTALTDSPKEPGTPNSYGHLLELGSLL